jgi:hypothetical protein
MDDAELLRQVMARLPELAVKAVEKPIGKKKEWVGLTDEEKLTIVHETDNPVDALAATEAKLKAKNV